MEILVNVVLPLSLAVIMLSLGIGLTFDDFQRVGRRLWVFGIGAICQVILLPIVAYIIIIAFGLDGEIAAGVMLIAFCPGGVTTNVLTRIAGGDVALSVSLTGVISLVSILTVPFLVGWAVVHFMGDAAPEITVASLAIAMFLITTLPVILGMTFRAMFPSVALRIEPVLVVIATILFAIIVMAAIAANWDLVLTNLTALGPSIATLIIVMMLAGLGIAALAGLEWPERKTISIEVGIQNGTLGITLAPIIAGIAGIPAIGLPSAIYGVIMYLVGIPFVLWLRRK